MLTDFEAQAVIQGVNQFDGAVRAWTIAHQFPALHTVAAWTSRLGSVSPLCWVAIGASLILFLRGRTRAAVSGLIAPALAVATYLLAKRFVARARPPSQAALAEATKSFPSAHATTSAAVCCTLAYVLWREEILSGPVALLLAVLPPLLIGASRIYLDVHWATDVLGGWAAGLLITALARVAYNRSPFFT